MKEEKLRLALSVLSGRRTVDTLDDHEFYLLGYDSYKFGYYGIPTNNEVLENAENIVFNAFCELLEREEMKYKYAKIKTFTEEGSVGDGLTEGKYYEIWKLDANLRGFDIFDDYGESIYCRVNDCAFLGGGNWELFAELSE